MTGVLVDLVLFLHLSFILFAIGGGLLALRWPRAAWFHIPVLAWAALIEFMGWICPLTPLENWLRAQGGGVVYERGFIEHYVVPIVYPPGLTVEGQWVLASLLLAVNAGVYGWALHRRRERRKRFSR
jgi:hypothetical protein